MYLLVDSTGLKLCGAGEGLQEKHGTKARRSWRTLYLGGDTDTGQIVAAALTTKEVDDGSQVGPLLDQGAETAPTQRDRHLRFVEPQLGSTKPAGPRTKAVQPS